ncbi:MAG: hypothetical protein AABW48_02285 [Nanoarchaeota archaeon]
MGEKKLSKSKKVDIADKISNAETGCGNCKNTCSGGKCGACPKSATVATKTAGRTKKSTGKSLDDLVGNSSAVYFISEVAYDAHYFNLAAYENLLTYIAQDSSVSGIVVDGALTRLDRPEFLSDALTYWVKSSDECAEETKKTPYQMQYLSMRDKQMAVLDEKLRELRVKVPNAELVLSMDSDDLQFTASAMLNELLVRRQEEFNENLSRLGRKIKGPQKEYKDLEKKHERAERAGKKDECGNLLRGMVEREKVIGSIKEEITALKEDRELFYRVKKSRPMHQNVTANFVADIYATYQSICDQVGVKLVTKDAILQFGNLTIDYGHNRHFTQAVIKRRDKALLEMTHGKMTEWQKKAMEQMKKAKGLDAIVESGHAGIGYKQLQKTHDDPAETNFKNQEYDPKIANGHITVAMVLPFEDQTKIRQFINGNEPVRMSVGKPVGTRRHAPVDRLKNGGVSGITVIRKNSEGVIGTEWKQYQDFIDGAITESATYACIYASSDEHIGAAESNWTVQDGLLELYKAGLKEPTTTFRGKPVFARGFISGGDTGEANSKKWDHRYQFKISPRKALEENVELLSNFNPKSVEDVRKLILKMTSDAMGGSVESMAVILDWVADHYESYFTNTLQHSNLKHAHVSVPGNHADNVLRDLGIREWDFFKQRLKGKGMSVYEVGKPGYIDDGAEQARVYLGGYSNARIINIPDYGVSVEGEPLFGPINLVVQHDPKGSGFSGVVGEGRNVDADLALAGHTHETWLKLYSTGDNKFSVAYRLAALQGVSPTEKLYAQSVPRTQAGHRFIMPKPGHFFEEALPGAYLRKKGQDALTAEITEAFKLSKK